jgi:multimeric flavodoxin WrbA
VILGINFSKRKNGNCRSSLEFISKSMKDDEVLIIDVPDLKVNSCCDDNYDCFRTGVCAVEDNMNYLIQQIRDAEKILIAIPVYRGHLCSEYHKIMKDFVESID